MLRVDQTAVQMGPIEEVRGALGVAKQFSWRARAAQTALVNGAIGLVWAPGGQPRVVFDFTISGEKIAAIDMLADPESLRELDLTVFND